MDLLRFDDDMTVPRATTIVAALDGWTDAGQAGTAAAHFLREHWPSVRLAEVDPDRVFDYRDRRPTLPINRGVLGTPEWPALELLALTSGTGTVLLLTGGEPDFGWRTLCDELVALARRAGVERYVGLGAVPGPVPHTRPTRVITTSDDSASLERFGRPHEQVVVPASFQVILESRMRDAAIPTLGFWARVPHYIAADYPEATQALLRRLDEATGASIRTELLDEEVATTSERLAAAADGSPEVAEHVTALEALYDADDEATLLGPLPTGDQIAAELEQFLRRRDDG